MAIPSWAFLHAQTTTSSKEVDIWRSVGKSESKASVQKLVDGLYQYVAETGSHIAFTKLKFLEKKYGVMASTVQTRCGQRYKDLNRCGYYYPKPNGYTILDSIYGLPVSSVLRSVHGVNDFRDELGFLTGEKAVDESLQLGSIATTERGGLGTEEKTVDISNVEGLQIKSHPWDEMLKEYDPPAQSALFGLVPEDDFLVHFSDVSALDRLENGLKEVFSLGDYFFNISDVLSMKESVAERLGIKKLEKFESAVNEIAFVSEDLSFIPRTNYAIIVKLKVDARSMIESYIDRGKSTHGSVGDYYVIASSENLFNRIKDASGGNAPSMLDAKDLKYAMATLDDRREGLVYFSEKFILKMVSPEYRINAGRRNLVLSKLENLQYAVFAYRSITGAWPKNLQQLVDDGYADKAYINALGSDYSIDQEGRVAHREWGTLWNITSVDDVAVGKVTEAEKRRYEQFKEGYERYWREFFDPVGIAIIASDQLYFHTIILPLIDESTYNMTKALIGDKSRVFDGISNPPRSVPLLFLSHLDFDAYLLETALPVLSSVDSARARATEAKILSDMSTIRVEAELYYDGNKNSYGPSTSSCTAGMFSSDAGIAKKLAGIQESTPNKARCYATNKEYAISVESKDMGFSYCVDSDGFVGYIDSNISGPSCGTSRVTTSEINDARNQALKNKSAQFSDEEKKKQVNEAFNKEVGKQLGLDKDFNLFGMVGDEFQFGVGDTIPYEISNIDDVDVYFALKLNDTERMKELINSVYSAFARESKGDIFGFFKLSSKEPLKKIYNDVEYNVIPLGSLDVYFFYRNDYLYVSIGRTAVEKLIDGMKGEGSTYLTDIQKRALDYTGVASNMLLTTDVTAFDDYKKGLVDRSLESPYAYSGVAKKFYGFASDYQFLKKTLKNKKGIAEKYFVNMPSDLFGIKIQVNDDSVLFGDQGYNYDKIDFGDSRYSYDIYVGYDDDHPIEKRVKFKDLFTDEQKQQILSDWNKFKGVSVAVKFTKEGLDTKVAIKNPLISESESSIGNIKVEDKSGSLMTYIIFGSAGIVLVIIIVAGVLVVLKKKKDSTDNIVSSKVGETQDTADTSGNEGKNIDSLIQYVRQSRSSGASDESIANELRNKGWDEASIEQAFIRQG